jgi:hypothetical protein
MNFFIGFVLFLDRAASFTLAPSQGKSHMQTPSGGILADYVASWIIRAQNLPCRYVTAPPEKQPM